MAVFWKLLALIAVVLMPLGMSAAPASAMQHSMTARSPAQHCPGQAPKHDGKGAFGECTMGCSAALPAANLQTEKLILIAPATALPGTQRAMQGLHPDTETPPPRLS